MIAHVLNYEVGDFVYTVGDLHLYKNHVPIKQKYKFNENLMNCLI